MTQMKIQRTQRGAAAARAAASQAGKGRFSGPGIMSNKVWLGVVMILLISGMALQAFAVVAPSWLRVRCQRGSLTVGLWTMCGEPLSNISWPRLTSTREKGSSGTLFHGGRQGSNSNINNLTKLESMKRSVTNGGQAEVAGYEEGAGGGGTATTSAGAAAPTAGVNVGGGAGGGGESSTERIRVNTSRWLLFWDNCLEMVTDEEHPHPVWFQATQLLETMGLGCTGITTLLLTLYACAPTFMALQVALGFAAASFTAGGFIIVGMFNISGGKFDVGVMLPPDVTCNVETSSLYYSFKLASVSVSLLGVAGAVATLASILEKGDAHQNRINRKGEEPMANAPPNRPPGNHPNHPGAPASSPPGTPTPPSTISDNESTPMSFDSIYESDYTYPYEGSKNTLRKKVSFQNREQLATALAAASTNATATSATTTYANSNHHNNAIAEHGGMVAGSGAVGHHSNNSLLHYDHSNTIPAPCNIPQSLSSPHIYKPVPRRLSVQSMPNNQENIQMRRQSSPLRIYPPQHTAQQPIQPLTLRQDSISSRGSNISSRSRESQDRRMVSSRNSSRNSMRHYDNPSRRSSRT